MDRLKSLLSFEGRASRLDYWRWVLQSSVLSAGLWLLSICIVLTEAPGSRMVAGLLLALIPLLVLPGIAVSLRRLHDRNRGWGWLLIFIALPYVLIGMASGYALRRVFLLTLVLALAAVIFSIWGWIEIGFLRGTRGRNEYGPEPIRTLRPRRAVAG